MEDNHIKLHHNFSDGNPHVLTILHGEAATIHDPEQVVLSGVITAPSEYLTKRRELCPPAETHVVFNRDGRKITLTVNEKDHFRTVVTGSLKKNKFLQSLHINSTTSYTISDLLKTLRFAKRFFANPTKHTELIVKLRNFTAKITQTTNNADDRAGNKLQTFESKVTDFASTTELGFILKLPLFDGTDEMNIAINIEIDVINGAVALFLVCDDLDELEDSLLDSLFQAEKKHFEDFVIIDQ
jgi:hypothetical protein